MRTDGKDRRRSNKGLSPGGGGGEKEGTITFGCNDVQIYTIIALVFTAGAALKTSLQCKVPQIITHMTQPIGGPDIHHMTIL